MKNVCAIAALTIAAGVFAPAYAAETPAKFEGGVLVGAKGMTLYTFDKDTPGSGKSACDAACVNNWPPLYAADGAAASGDYTIATLYNGKKMWAYKGKPVYYWVKDKKAGDRTGDGVGKVWHVVTP